MYKISVWFSFLLLFNSAFYVIAQWMKQKLYRFSLTDNGYYCHPVYSFIVESIVRFLFRSLISFPFKMCTELWSISVFIILSDISLRTNVDQRQKKERKRNLLQTTPSWITFFWPIIKVLKKKTTRAKQK